MKYHILSLSICAVFLAHCTKESSTLIPPEAAPQLRIQLENNTTNDLSDVHFTNYGASMDIDFGAIAVGATSDYIAVDSLFLMGNFPVENLVKGQVGSDAFQAGVHGYCPVGETFTTKYIGDYTLVLSEYNYPFTWLDPNVVYYHLELK